MKVAVLTLGCRVNQSESDVIEGTLRDRGISIVGLDENPEVCVVNTCAVTSKSDYNSRQIIRRASRQGAKVIVTGCYSQLKRKEALDLPGVVKVIDIKRKNDIVELISGLPSEISYAGAARARPFLKVQEGCNFNCSYCTVPKARGRSQSIPGDLLVSRANAIIERGFKEIVLTGIHLGTYGHDLNERLSVAGLLGKLLAGTTVHRIRLSSLEIGEISDELLELMSDPRVCGHLHVPLQSGSDRILQLMRRGYRALGFQRRLEYVAGRLGPIGLGTDVIVGFPGEEDADYLETVEVVRSLPFTYVHIFPYSPRPGTDAAEMAGRRDGREVSDRCASLKRLADAKNTAYLKRHIGSELEIIVEEGLTDGFVSGTSSNYLKIQVPGEGLTTGTVAIAKPWGIRNNRLRADVVRIP